MNKMLTRFAKLLPFSALMISASNAQSADSCSSCDETAYQCDINCSRNYQQCFADQFTCDLQYATCEQGCDTARSTCASLCTPGGSSGSTSAGSGGGGGRKPPCFTQCDEGCSSNYSTCTADGGSPDNPDYEACVSAGTAPDQCCTDVFRQCERSCYSC